jgi:Asp-tRNA(Asn)/Glu-tRNA(Gln) amidotransferase A subunit family amidase
MFTLDIMQGAD